MHVLRKSCPRCEGDLSRVDDIGDTYYSCVQCGHVMYYLGVFERPVLRAGQFVAMAHLPSNSQAA